MKNKDHDDFSFSTKTIESIESLIQTLNERSRQKITVANWFLLFAFLIVTIGISIFIFANKLTDSENVTSTFNKLRNSKVLLDSVYNVNQHLAKESNRIFNSIDNIFKIIQVYETSTALHLPKNQNQQKTYPSGVSYAIEGRNSIEYLILADSLTRKIQSKNSQNVQWIKRSMAEISSVGDDVLNEVKVYDSSIITYEFFNALSTRIGAIIIIFFVVQVLIRIYRYNTRLGNYYKARADALKLYLQDDSLPLDKLIEVLSPDGLDIGVSKTPIDQVVEIFRHAQRQTKKGE
jgi:hypothetical protein